jgi:hypothetical protein
MGEKHAKAIEHFVLSVYTQVRKEISKLFDFLVLFQAHD